MKSNEYTDPNYGICPGAADVLVWQAAAALEPTDDRAAGIVEADAALKGCGRCVAGSLLRGDPYSKCALAELATRLTSLGPEWARPNTLAPEGPI